MKITKDDLLIYIVCHDDISERIANQLVSTQYPYGIVRKFGPSPYFENQIFDYMADHTDEWINKKFVGIITYSFQAKMKKQIDLLKAVQDNANSDLISLNNLTFIKTKMNLHISFIEGCTIQHGPFFFMTYFKILRRLGYTEEQIMDKNGPAFFCNWWIAKTVWMHKYVKFYKKCKWILETDATLNKYICEHSYYPGRVDKDTLIKMTNKPYYTLHPFLFERLPCFFFYHEGAKICQYGEIGWYMFAD